MTRHWRLGCIFLLAAVALFWIGTQWVRNFWAAMLLFSGGEAFLGLSLCYLLPWPGLLGKTGSGRLFGSSYLLFWPYHLNNYLTLCWSRFVRREPPCDEILPGLFLGGRLLDRSCSLPDPSQLSGVLDLTSELSEVAFLRRAGDYLCIPLLDRTAPSAEDLKRGIDFIAHHHKKGAVYVHCAAGHGRSGTFVIAYLVASGQAPSVEAAFELARARRPRVCLSSAQWRLLRRTFAHE